MTNYKLYKKTFPAPELNKKDILRYMGCKETTDELDRLIDEGINISFNSAVYDICFAKFPISFSNQKIDLGFCETNSADLRKNLDGCKEVIIFAATVGINFDKLITKYSMISPPLAYVIHAIGTERIEALCDSFVMDLSNEFDQCEMILRPRFSAGYGDFPIEHQKDIFRALSCHTQIGLTLNDSMIMSPSKSVTAIIGIKNKDSK